MTSKEIQNFLLIRPGYIKFGKYALAKHLNISDVDACEEALREARTLQRQKEPSIYNQRELTLVERVSKQDIFKNAFLKKKEHVKSIGIEIKKSKFGKNVLVIGDLHLPFSLDGYLEHCIKVYEKHNCDTVVFIGDILDLHFSSYHETSTEGYGATQEHDLSVEMLKKWYHAFPKAYVTIGNHDALIYRKAMSAGISKRWIQNYSQVLGTPGWEWVTDVVIDDVLYTHGTTNAYTKAKQNLMSTVQGHLHSQAGIQFYVGAKSRIFGFQVGCGVDMKSYAMEYGRNFPKPVISCGVVIDGLHPYLEVMNL